MLKRLLLLTTLGVILSGCYMVPMALVGPAVSNWSTASIMQSAATTSANYLIKKSTGKTITEHAFNSINGDIIRQTYFTEASDKKKIESTKKSVNKIIK